MRKHYFIIFSLIYFLFPNNLLAEKTIYKCEPQKGIVNYQNSPCESENLQTEIKLPPFKSKSSIKKNIKIKNTKKLLAINPEKKQQHCQDVLFKLDQLQRRLSLGCTIKQEYKIKEQIEFYKRLKEKYC